MSDAVDPHSIHSARSTATANFVVEVRFREREYVVIFVELYRFYISLHLVSVKVQHKDTVNAFFCFGWVIISSPFMR